MGMKMLLVSLAALLILIQPGFAQDQQPPSADEIVSKMQSKLGLTPDQVSAITPIIEKYASKFQELRQSMEDGTADDDTVHGQMKQLRADESQELGQVLSSDQLKQWKSLQAQHRHKSEDSGETSGSEGTGSSN